MIVIVFGLPGSGKTYFAERLAKMIHADHINSDRLRKKIFRQRTYSPEEKAAVYQVMLGKMREAIALNRNMVLDATFHTHETRKHFIQDAGDRLFLIEVRAGENLIKERLKKERPDSEADFEVYQSTRQKWETLDQPHLLLESTDTNIDNMLQKAAEYLQWKDDKRADRSSY